MHPSSPQHSMTPRPVEWRPCAGCCSWLLQRLSRPFWGQFPRPAALPVPGGCWMALGRGGGSAAIWVEGEAKGRPQPGNGLHVAFPTAVTPGVGSAGGQEPLCLPPAAPWMPCESRSWETRSRVISAVLQAEPLHELVTCPGLAPAQNHFPLLRKGRLKGGTVEGRCSQPCSGSHPFFQRCAGEGREQQLFPAQTGHQSS